MLSSGGDILSFFLTVVNYLSLVSVTLWYNMMVMTYSTVYGIFTTLLQVSSLFGIFALYPLFREQECFVLPRNIAWQLLLNGAQNRMNV